MKANQFLYKNDEGYANMVPIVLAVIITFAIIFIGGYVNGVIHDNLEDTLETYPWSSGDGIGIDTVGNKSYERMTNIAYNWDDSLDIVQIVVVITLLAMALGAIFLFTRFRT